MESIQQNNIIIGSLDTTRQFATFLLRGLSSIQMIHWYTNDYNTHKIMGDLYDDLKELFDELQEEIIGTAKSSNVGFPQIQYATTCCCNETPKYKDDNLNILNIYYDLYNSITNVLLCEELNSYISNVKSGIPNTIDGIITRLNKTNYLLSII